MNVILCAQAPVFLPPIMRALLRGGKPHWNPTVRRMTVLVLEALRNIDKDTFNATAAAQWGKRRGGDEKKGSGVLPAAQVGKPLVSTKLP